MCSISLCAHCWRYPRLACFHLSSFVLNPPPAGTELFLVTAETDYPVREVVNFFRPKLPLTFHDIVLPATSVVRRVIGRNIVAKQATTDWTMMTDIDSCFGPGAVASICELLGQLGDEKLLAFIGQISGSRDNVTGSAEIAKCQPPQIIDTDSALYAPHNFRFASGSNQLVRGSFLREHGYLGNWGRRWHTPAAVAEWPKQRTPEDHKFRGQFKPEQRAKLPSVMSLKRIRHSAHGGLDGEVNL